MQKFKFTSNPTPTVGVEIEMALVDPETGALKSAISDVLNKVPAEHREKIKPELMQCYVEVNSDTCNSIDAIEEDLRKKILAIQSAADESGGGLYWTGTHPFSLWRDQTPSPSERYANCWICCRIWVGNW